MALTAAAGMIAGAFHLQVMKRDANGYAKGVLADPDITTGDTTSSALLVGGLDSFTAPTPTIETAINKGGQKLVGSMALGVTAFGTPQVTLTEFNETFNALIKGSAADVSTITNWTMNAANSNQIDLPRFIVVVTGKFLDSSTLGEYHLNWVFHNCQILASSGPNLSQAGGENPNPITYDLNLSLSSRNITGTLMSASSGMQVVDGSDTWTLIRSRWPLAVTSWIADGVAIVFTLGYRPFYSTVTTGNTDNSTTIDGVATAATSIDTTTGVVTVAAAGSSGDIHEAVYQTKFIAI